MPNNRPQIEKLKSRLIGKEPIGADPFQFASELCRLVSLDFEGAEAHELVLLALDRRDEFGKATILLDGLVRQLGLFPYLDPNDLSLADALAYEAHRPDNMADEFVFHRAQAYAYRLLMSGVNVALSAPTSFGKSLIIDAMIASNRYSNIVVVVPTLALIDETRRRLTARFSEEYKVITHPTQTASEKNVFVLTQERVLDLDDWSFVDFFVIDEFYKLARPREKGDDRYGLLNQAFYELAKNGAQFYMLGPNIQGVTQQNHLRVELQYVQEPNYHTVATHVHRVEGLPQDEFETLIDLCRTLDSSTIIFCKSPARASEVARKLVEAKLDTPGKGISDAASWIGKNYHPEWHFREALSNGIGIHHGRIPRALAQYVVRRFNEGDIRFLVCTSTLIEGVNTAARNIIIFDNKISRENIDLFTFNNIKGRSGRMFRHFVGHVYVFHDDPQSSLPFVDVPAMSQSGDAPDSLLLQFDEEDLSEESKARLRRFQSQTHLSIEVIRKNRGVEPDVQIAVAKRISQFSSDEKSLLAWDQFPSYNQLVQITQLIFEEFDGRKIGSGSARSPEQLAVMIQNLQRRPTISQMIDQQIKYSQSPDEAVTRVLDFIRLWTDFHFPKLLRTISSIQRDVLSREGLPAGNYDYYASQVQNLFMSPILPALEEYGIPLVTARKFEQALPAGATLDESLEFVRRMNFSRITLDPFERGLAEDAQQHL